MKNREMQVKSSSPWSRVIGVLKLGDWVAEKGETNTAMVVDFYPNMAAIPSHSYELGTCNMALLT